MPLIMHSKSQEAVLLRLTPGQRRWLQHKAHANNRSQSAEIREILQAAIDADPLSVYVNHWRAAGKNYFAVSVGKHGREEFETEDREKAIAAAKDKAIALDLDPNAIKYNIESDELTS